MKTIKYETVLNNINPRRLFSRSKKSPKISKSDPSYSSSSSDTSSSPHKQGTATPTTVLPDSDYSSAHLLHAFDLIDLNKDGKISVAELELILTRVAGASPPPTKEEVAAMLTELDIDGDGCVSLEEFGAIGSEPARVSELKDAFAYFDVNGDGRITAEELLEGLSKVWETECSLSECKRMIAEVDVNKDGFVCFEDFSRMMTMNK